MEFNMYNRHDREIFANLVYMLQSNGIQFKLSRCHLNTQIDNYDHIEVEVI